MFRPVSISSPEVDIQWIKVIWVWQWTTTYVQVTCIFDHFVCQSWAVRTSFPLIYWLEHNTVTIVLQYARNLRGQRVDIDCWLNSNIANTTASVEVLFCQLSMEKVVPFSNRKSSNEQYWNNPPDLRVLHYLTHQCWKRMTFRSDLFFLLEQHLNPIQTEYLCVEEKSNIDSALSFFRTHRFGSSISISFHFRKQFF